MSISALAGDLPCCPDWELADFKGDPHLSSRASICIEYGHCDRLASCQ